MKKNKQRKMGIFDIRVSQDHETVVRAKVSKKEDVSQVFDRLKKKFQ